MSIWFLDCLFRHSLFNWELLHHLSYNWFSYCSFHPPLFAPWCPLALRVLPYFPHIYLALTHLLLLIDLMSLLHSLFVSPNSSPHFFLPPSLPPSPQHEETSLHYVSLHYRSAWTALTLVMQFHYCTKVRDPRSERLSSILSALSLPPCPQDWSICCDSACVYCGSCVCHCITNSNPLIKCL